MRNLFLLTTLILGSLLVQAEGIEFYKGSFEEAKKLALEEDKLIFVDAYTSWCGPCKRMARDVFPKDKAGNYFNDAFINMKIDMEKGEGKQFARTYRVSSYPTLLFVDGTGKVVHRARGGRSVDGLIKEGEKALLPNPKVINQMKQRYEGGERGKGFLSDYVKTLVKARKDYQAPLTDYLALLSEEELLTKSNAELILKSTKDLDAVGLNYISKYRKYFDATFGKENINNKIAGVGTQTAKQAARKQDTKLLAAANDFLKSQKVKDYKKLIAENEMRYAKAGKDWDAYLTNAQKYIKKFDKNNAQLYNDVAWTVYMNVKDEGALKKALGLAESSIGIESKSYNNLTAAYLLYKLQDFKPALAYAEKAHTMALEEKVKTASAHGLMIKLQSKVKANG